MHVRWFPLISKQKILTVEGLKHLELEMNKIWKEISVPKKNTKDLL